MIDLDAIEARIRDCTTYNFGLWNADKLAHEDAPAMLTELRHLRVIASGNQGAIVNSIIERTRTEVPEPSAAAVTLSEVHKFAIRERDSIRGRYGAGSATYAGYANACEDILGIIGGMSPHPGIAEPQGEPSTPDGWFVFGSHAPYPWVGKMEFSAEKDEAGMPLWERPVQGEPSDAQVIERLRGQIEEARNAWWSATEQGDNGLVYTDRIEDAMDGIWSAIGHADWTPDAAGGAR